MCVKVMLETRKIKFLTGYAPKIGSPEEERDEFYDQVESLGRGIPMEEAVVIRVELTRHVESDTGYFTRNQGFLKLGMRNDEGREIVETAKSLNLMITNAWLKK